MINENYQKLMALKMIRGWVGHCMRCLDIVLKIKAYLSVIVHPVKNKNLM